MNDRRKVLIAISSCALAVPFDLVAQSLAHTKRIGILLGVSAHDAEFKRRIEAFSRAFTGLGWIEGKTFTYEVRHAEGKSERLVALANELVAANVDVIVTQGGDGSVAARKASGAIPIVMASVGDAVGQGLVASLARPGGNITGLSLLATEQSAKRLQLIKEVSPSLGRFAVIWNANAGGHRLQMREMESAAQVLRITLHSYPVRNTEEIDIAFRNAMQAKCQAVVTMEDSLIQFNRAHIVELAMKQRIPVMSEFSPVTEAGGLMSYGPDQVDMWRRAASYVDKILKGTKPGDLPIELPTKFELVINAKTAKALGIKIPNSILVQATKVIE